MQSNMRIKYDHGVLLVLKFINKAFPEVIRQLKYWKGLSKEAGDSVLKDQAAKSIEMKKFHAFGGSIYSLYPNVDLKKAITFIVALQTISDYLDNLCDRAGITDEKSFSQLHLSMLDAVDLNREPSDYYLYYPHKSDNGYLKRLVDECRENLSSLPSYPKIVEFMKKYVKLYSELQTFKHLDLDEREGRLENWSQIQLSKYSEITGWEFSAATGSTLGMFMLFAAASEPTLQESEVLAIDKAYFPWICGLHILLDYYIDLQEDIQMGDLNFTSYYESLKHCEQRITFFIERSLESCRNLRYPEFHITIVKGLLAMYLSDPKANTGDNRRISPVLLKKGGPGTTLYHSICRALRFAHIL